MKTIAEKSLGKKVLIRAYSAGVHFGTLTNVDKNEGRYDVELTDSRRIYSWTGAFTLSELAVVGSTKTDSKISITIPTIYLQEVIEIIPMTDEAYNNLNAIKRFIP